MAKINITFTESDIIGMARDLKNWAGIKVPVKDLTKLVNTADLDTKLDLAQGSSGKYGLDTGARENLIDLIGRKLTGLSWPTYGSSTQDKRDFNYKLVKSIKRHNWKLEEELWDCDGV